MSYNLQHNYRPITNDWTFFLAKSDTENLYSRISRIEISDPGKDQHQTAVVYYTVAQGKIVNNVFEPALGNEDGGVICTFTHDGRITDMRFTGTGENRVVEIEQGISQSGVGFITIAQQLFNACANTLDEVKFFPNFAAWNSKRNIHVEKEMLKIYGEQ